MGDTTTARQVEDATSQFVDVLAGVGSTTWTATPPDREWSLSQVLEHVAITNGRILERLTDGLRPIGDATPDITDDEMPYLFYGGEEPPNLATPTGTWTDIDEAVERLRSSAGAIAEWARETSLDLRGYGMVHPLFGLLDGEQWVRFAAVHTWRHRPDLQMARRALEG